MNENEPNLNQNKPTFVYGQLLAYCPKDTRGEIYKVELCVFKRYNEDMTKAFCWYHTGDTAACTSLEDLYSLDNDWYFVNDALKLGGARDD